MSNWIVTTENRGAIPEHFRPLVITGETGEPIIARLPDGRSPKDYANARLIAAAPAMYDALANAIRELKWAADNSKNYEEPVSLAVIQGCEAALALVKNGEL